MFEDISYCHIIHDAWWYYYHHKNYVLWQERADQLMVAMRKRIAAQYKTDFDPQRQRDWVAALEERRRMAAQKQRDEAAALQEQLTFVRDVWDDDFVLAWDDDLMLDATK